MEKISIGNLICALRPEYLKNRKHLKTLRDYVETTGNLYFDLEDRKGDKSPVLSYGFYEDNCLEDILSGRRLTHPITLQNGVYVINDERAKITNQKEFMRQSSEILTSDFANNIITYIDHIEGSNFEISRLSIGMVFISITVAQRIRKDKRYIMYRYGVERDKCTIEVSNYSKDINVPDVLGEEIPISLLPDYHASVIEKNKRLIYK